MFELPAGTTVTLLAYENFVNHWAYRNLLRRPAHPWVYQPGEAAVNT